MNAPLPYCNISLLFRECVREERVISEREGRVISDFASMCMIYVTSEYLYVKVELICKCLRIFHPNFCDSDNVKHSESINFAIMISMDR